MRSHISPVLALALIAPMELFSQSQPGVVKVSAYKDLFITGEVYIGGQPTLEMLRWLKEQGVTMVVNLRTENENKDFTNLAFNEATVVKDMGLNYVSIPMEKGSPKTVEAFAELMKSSKGKTLLHCLGAGRATNLWMAYLMSYRGLSADAALDIGRQLKFSFPLEDLLGGRMSMKVIPGEIPVALPQAVK
jgi:protein tyrosine phosphatase (PTP) superfamily phosphohydrolase (DUF442 family)